MTKKILLLLLVNVFAVLFIRAQQITRFAYIQTDNKQPFYVKWNNKVLSSSSTGYLILSKIKEQQINVVVGFPKNLYPEQSFTISFNGTKDAGFLLKDFDSKGWGLYNLQTLMVVHATVTEAPVAFKQEPATKEQVINPPKVEEAKSPFGDLLVQVTQDSTVRNIAVEKPQPPPVVKKEEPVKPKIDSVAQKIVKQEEKPAVQEPKKETKPETKEVAVSETKKADSLKAVTIPEAKPAVTETKKEEKSVEKEIVKPEVKKEEPVKTKTPKETQPVVHEPQVKTQPVELTKSAINLFATNENAESYDYIYVTEDKTGARDTISISIKKDKVEIKPVVKQEPGIKKDTVQQQPKTEPKFIEIIADTAKASNEPAVIEPIKKDTLVKAVDTVAKETVKEITAEAKPAEEVKSEPAVIKEPIKETPKETAKVVMVNTDCKDQLKL